MRTSIQRSTLSFLPLAISERYILARKMNNSFFANIGHLDTEIDIVGLEGPEGKKVDYILTVLLDVTVRSSWIWCEYSI